MSEVFTSNPALSQCGNRAHPLAPDRLADLERVLADPVTAIEAVRAAHPLLGTHGFGEREPFHKGDHAENFLRLRAEMTEPRRVEQFVRAVQWLATRNRRETVNRQCSSYKWKHVAESWHRQQRNLTVHQQAECYVSNGQLICAALALGFGMERIRWYSPSINVFLTIGAPLIREKRGRR